MDEAAAPTDYFDAQRARVITLINDINNQLSISTGYLHFLREDHPKLSRQQEQWLTTVATSSDRAAALLRALHTALLG